MSRTRKFLYHATRLEHLTKICEQGLLPNEDRDTNFDDYPGYGRLFVANSQEAAEFYRDTFLKEFQSPSTILRFPARLARIKDDEYGNLGDFHTTDSITPEHIEIQHDGGWIPLASVTLGDLPTINFAALYHVGTLNLRTKQSVSLEGSGLSVSLHPNVWRILGSGFINGNLFELRRPGNTFVDFTNFSNDHKQKLALWGQICRYLNPTTASPDGYWGSEILWQRFPGMVPHQGLALQFALMVYLEDECPNIDGIWWNEPLVVASPRRGGSAPRGVILLPRLSAWTTERIPENLAPDIALTQRPTKPKAQG
jgi:hypothetical protein